MLNTKGHPLRAASEVFSEQLLYRSSRGTSVRGLCISNALIPWSSAAGEEVAIAAAVLDLFWRLPKLAVKFLETPQVAPLPAGTAAPPQGLVVLTIQLEERLARMPAANNPLPRILTSEYRAPLLRFLNK